MSTAMNFSTKSFQARPPDKGAFPLDHFGECAAFKEQFLECLRQSGAESSACRPRAMAYLQCRMERRGSVRFVMDCDLINAFFCCFYSRQLMANEPMEKLGFKDLIDEKAEGKPEKL
ncbi:COX19 protein, partial [Crypturellus undulatus]|nr:COX19 protein [Crypturellus undulatus]